MTIIDRIILTIRKRFSVFRVQKMRPAAFSAPNRAGTAVSGRQNRAVFGENCCYFKAFFYLSKLIARRAQKPITDTITHYNFHLKTLEETHE